MESKKDFSSETDKDETLVTPRFDSDEAETARPVVPLAVVSGEAETYDAPAAAGMSPRAARRASLPLALVLVSALAGSVLGGAGLYLFQKSRQQQSAAQTEQTNGASDAAAGQTNEAPISETTPAPSPTQEEAGALAADLPEEVAEVPVAAEVPDDKEHKKEKEDADKKRDESKREDDDDDDATPRGARVSAAASEKRGKKGERDDDDSNYRARESRPRRVEDDSPDEGEYYDRGGARRIGSIVYEREARRERRRQRRQPAVDRVRGIFEGQP